MEKKEVTYDEVVSQANACYGAIVGAALGDAYGATIEFARRLMKEEEVDRAMSLPGGGPHRAGDLCGGQITDDSEMALGLLDALAQCKGGLNMDLVAGNYYAWLISPPFDIGNTTKNAISVSPPAKAADMRANAETKNKLSASNGSLMRITPMVVYCRKIPEDVFPAVIREEVTLTHSNETCIQSSITYAVALRHLLNNVGDNIGAFSAAEKYANKNSSN